MREKDKNYILRKKKEQELQNGKASSNKMC